jgi:hypothetical protein
VYSYDEFQLLHNKPGIVTCPCCFIQPRGRFFTRFSCGDVICSKCHKGQTGKACPVCGKLSLLRKMGETMTNDQYCEFQDNLSHKQDGSGESMRNKEVMLQMLHHYQQIFDESVQLLQRNKRYMQEQESYTKMLEEEAISAEERYVQQKEQAQNFIRENSSQL